MTAKDSALTAAPAGGQFAGLKPCTVVSHALFFRRSLIVAGLAMTVTTCRDAFEPGATAQIAVVPILPSRAELADFGLTIDGVRFVVVRPPADTLADTTVALPPNVRELALDLRVPIRRNPEEMNVSVIALSGAMPLFIGTQLIPVPTPLPPPEIRLDTYVGPAVDSLVILPGSPFILVNDSLRLQVLGFNGGAPVPQFYVAWSTSDTLLARIDGRGTLRAPATRSVVRVRARTPTGTADSVLATFTPPATQLVIIAGAGQTDTVGTALAVPLEVEARASDSLGVGGVTVRFRALTGGGSVTDTLVVTDGAGRARTTARLGGLLGPQSFEASATGLAGSPTTFGVTALAGSVAQLLVVAGDGQLATVNTLLPTAPAVRLRDALGNPVAGVSVTFLPTGGGVTGGNQITDATGLATVGSWTLGTLAGANTLTATGAGLTHVFNANGVAGAATALLATAGDLQSAVVGAVVGTAPRVRAQDQFGNPVPGAAITFAVSGGGGSVSGPSQLTNAAGIATVGGWTLGTVTGTNALTATLAGLTPVTFTATGLAGAATRIVQLAGDGQAAIVNTILPTAAAVIVRDQFNNPVPGVPVLFAPASGGGSVTGGSALTDTAGVATVGSWQLGTLVGQNTLTATASGLTGSPVVFTASATRDVAAQLLRVSVDTQTATAGQSVSTPPAVRVADQYGNPVSGASVTFTLTGALIGSLAPSSATTDSMGVARVTSWSLAAIAGLNTLDAAVPGLVGSPMTFSANGTTTTATNMLLNAGDGQLGVVGTALPTVYSVAVRNALGLPVQNVQVHWAAGPAGGSMNPATSLTDASGIASSTRTLGPGAVTQTATASVGGLTGSPVTFTATALPGAPAQLVKQSVDPQSGTVATAVTAPVIKVADQFGNGVAGAIVDFAPSGGGTLGAVKDTSDGAGLATSSSWTLGTLAGMNTLSASAAGVQAVTFSATGVAGAVSQLVFITPPSHTLADDSISPAPQVAFQDTFGNTVPEATGVVVLGIGAVPDFFAKLTGTLSAAAAGGVATFRHAQIDSAGQGYTLRASDGNVVGESPQFDIGGVIAAIPVARGPVAAALDPRTKKIYVPGASSVSVLLDDRELLPQIPGFESPFGVAANAITNQIYVSSLLGLVVIDGTRTPDVVRLSIPVGTGAKGVAVDEQTNFIYVAATDPLKGGPALVPVDGSKDLVVLGDVVALPAPGVGVAFNRNDGLVYVAIPTLQEVVVIDPKPGGARVVAEIRNLGKLTHGVAVDVRTNLLYVTNQGDNNVSVINLVDFKEIARLQVGLNPEGLGVDSDRGVVYVANSGANTVSLIDGVKLNVFATLVVGPAPKAPVVDPVTGRVYVPTQQDDRVRVIQP
jgi:adhesin/invasin